MDEFSFLLFEKSMRKKIHIKIWILKKIYCKHDIQSLTQLATIKCGRWLAKTTIHIYLDNMDCIIDHMYVACIQKV